MNINLLPELLAAPSPLLPKGWQQSPRRIDDSFNQLPTLTADIVVDGEALATWKTNLQLLPADCFIVAPLVIQWAEPSRRKSGDGHLLMKMIAEALPAALRQLGHQGPLMLASGNLTVERAGLPFFRSLGWEIISSPDEAKACPYPDGAQYIYAHLTAITAEHRAKAGGAVSFAYTRGSL